MTTHVQASEPFVLGVRIPKLDISDFVGFCLADSGQSPASQNAQIYRDAGRRRLGNPRSGGNHDYWITYGA